MYMHCRWFERAIIYSRIRMQKESVLTRPRVLVTWGSAEVVYIAMIGALLQRISRQLGTKCFIALRVVVQVRTVCLGYRAQPVTLWLCSQGWRKLSILVKTVENRTQKDIGRQRFSCALLLLGAVFQLFQPVPLGLDQLWAIISQIFFLINGSSTFDSRREGQSVVWVSHTPQIDNYPQAPMLPPIPRPLLTLCD